MEIKFEIADNKVKSFTESAKRRLHEQTEKYTLEIIKEAEKVEGLIRENGAKTEITDNIIFQAVRRNKTSKRKNMIVIIVRIVSELFLFVSGLLFIPEKFITENNTLDIKYFILFAIITLVALVATIVTYFIGGE